jgi:hypothetical protein
MTVTIDDDDDDEEMMTTVIMGIRIKMVMIL